MGSAETRNGPIGLFADVLHVPVGTGIATRSVFFQGGKVPLKTNTGTALAPKETLQVRLGSGAVGWKPDLAHFGQGCSEGSEFKNYAPRRASQTSRHFPCLPRL